MTTIVAVPVKDLVNAKQRLVPFLSPAERSDLARAMLEDVLEVLGGARIGEILVVTRDPAAGALARRYGAAIVGEEANRGHTEAVAHAQRAALACGASRFLTIPGDVPCTTAQELTTLAAALPSGPAVAFVPSLSGYGTNAALLQPPDCLSLKFGEPSFDNHLLAARAAGLRPVVLRLPGIGLDIDAPEDLGLLMERGPSTRSAGLLATLGVRGRLSGRGPGA
jgi:2-phospho-L-lactate guanylyltransferase